RRIDQRANNLGDGQSRSQDLVDFPEYTGRDVLVDGESKTNPGKRCRGGFVAGVQKGRDFVAHLLGRHGELLRLVSAKETIGRLGARLAAETVELMDGLAFSR